MGLDICFYKRKNTEIGYFRKVNFLVKFFMDKGMDVEHQFPFVMLKEDAEELLSRCNKVLKDHSKAEKLLPTMSGFFFGNTDYNSHYYDDVLTVRDFIKDKLLPQFDHLNEDEAIDFDISY